MNITSHRARLLFAVSALILAAPISGLAQQLEYLAINAGTLVQGDCYDLWVWPISPGLSLDIEYSVNGIPQEPISGWPIMEGDGVAHNICTSSTTPLGTITFDRFRPAGGSASSWVGSGAGLTVLPQVGGASYSPGSGHAGADGYVFTVAGGANTDVRVHYLFGGGEGEGVVSLDGDGKYYSGTLDHYVYLGDYVVTAVQNAAAQSYNWTPADAGFTILPPQPQTLTLNRSSVVAGATNGSQIYRMNAVNGAEMYLRLKHTGPDGTVTEPSWPYLYADSPGNWNGHSGDISVSKCTLPGHYVFIGVENSLNGSVNDPFVSVSAPLDVVFSGVPTISSMTPSAGLRGTNVTMTINGQNLCGVTLTTNYPGLTIPPTGINNPNWSDGTSISATLNVSGSAAAGNALVTLHARGGDVNFYFGITQAGQGLPTITSISPSNGMLGATVPVTITGTNLIVPILSTTWAGLTFTNVVPAASGTSLTANFVIAGSAQSGAPPVKVTTGAGFATNSSFFIGSLPSLTREYIYLGDRVIAVDTP